MLSPSSATRYHEKRIHHLGHLTHVAVRSLEKHGALSPIYTAALGAMLEYAYRMRGDLGVLMYALNLEKKLESEASE